MKRFGGMVVLLGAAMAFGACSSSSPKSSASSKTVTSCGGVTGPSVTTTKYVMSLDIGPEEMMYTQQQAASTHPTDGEVMISGSMAMTDAGGGARHLEVHICQPNGTVVQGANPTITIQDSAGGQAVDVPAAVMQGVTAGVSDLHYGNNVNVVPGHTYDVTVVLNGDTGRFHTTVS